jgi:hypothetical protein
MISAFRIARLLPTKSPASNWTINRTHQGVLTIHESVRHDIHHGGGIGVAAHAPTWPRSAALQLLSFGGHGFLPCFRFRSHSLPLDREGARTVAIFRTGCTRFSLCSFRAMVYGLYRRSRGGSVCKPRIPVTGDDLASFSANSFVCRACGKTPGGVAESLDEIREPPTRRRPMD